MPKGRGSNEARRNHRLAGRRGGGTQAGITKAEFASRQATAPRLGWWKRTKLWLERTLFDVEVKVAPKRALRRLERRVHEKHTVSALRSDIRQVTHRQQRR